MRDARECVGCGELHPGGGLVCDQCAGDEVVVVCGTSFVTRSDLVATEPPAPEFASLARRAKLENTLAQAATLARTVERMQLEHPAEIAELRRLHGLIARAQLFVLRESES